MTRTAILLVNLCFMVGVYGPAQLAAGDTPAILILPFDNSTGRVAFDALEEGIPDLLTAFLSPYEEQIRVVDRTLGAVVLAEHRLSRQGLSGPRAALQSTPELAQAKYILRGSVSGLPGSFRIDAFLYETETTRLVKSLENAGPAERLNVAVQDIALGLAGHFSTSIVEVAELPVDPDPLKSVNLISLLGHYYSGQYEKALTYAMKTLAQQPHDELGLYWLARSFLDSGLEDHALLAFQDFLEHFPDSPKAEEAKYRVEELQNKEVGSDVR